MGLPHLPWSFKNAKYQTYGATDEKWARFLSTSAESHKRCFPMLLLWYWKFWGAFDISACNIGCAVLADWSGTQVRSEEAFGSDVLIGRAVRFVSLPRPGLLARLLELVRYFVFSGWDCHRAPQGSS
jgi:hypothetical protein